MITFQGCIILLRIDLRRKGLTYLSWAWEWIFRKPCITIAFSPGQKPWETHLNKVGQYSLVPQLWTHECLLGSKHVHKYYTKSVATMTTCS